MSVAIRIPDIGTTVTRVTLAKWLRTEGEAVKRGDFLCEIETDKAVSELESIAEGTILKILVTDGTELEQGTIIAYIGNEGEPIPDPTAGTPLSREINSQSPAGLQNNNLNIPPLIRNFAKNIGVDIGSVTGTGPGGRITKEDVLNAKERTEGDHKDASLERPISPNQAIVARQVVQSQRDIPPVHVQCRINMLSVLGKRREIQEKTGIKISFDAFFTEAAAKVSKEFPQFRSVIRNGKIVESGDTNIGIAISYSKELYIPVIHHADNKGVEEIHRDISLYAEKSREGRFTPEDLSGAIFTISNLGMFPIQSFSAIIPPGQSAIISIGSIEETPIVKNNEVVIAPMAVFTLSVDHRLINGREAAEFLSFLKTEIERP